jgi:outer membrane protein assembly factor BamB
MSRAFASLFLVTLATSVNADADDAQNWPRFRGPHATGVIDGQPLPVKWNGESGENVVWRVKVAGLANSSPIVWGDAVYLTTAETDNPDPVFKPGYYGEIASVENDGDWTWKLLCLDKNTGLTRWEQTATEGTPRVKRHTKSTHADNTPATNGEYVVAMFGSQGLFCYTIGGELKWRQDLGTLEAAFSQAPSAQWEFGSSPIVYKEMVIVQVDVLNESYVAAFRLEDGREVWNTSRDEAPSWSTPTVVEHNGRADLVTNATNAIRGYDPANGEQRWQLVGNSTIVVPTPFMADGLIYLTSGYRPIQPIYAVKCGATGDITLPEGASTSEWVAWSQRKQGPYMPTPVVYKGLLFASDRGILTIYDAKTGEVVKRRRMPQNSGAFISSLVAGDGKVYICSEDGDVFVVQADKPFELLSTNPMGETLLATPAISDGVIYFRGRHTLYAVKG